MSVEEAARIIETLTDVSPGLPKRGVTRQERQEQVERVKKFLSLPVHLQEGCLKYAQNIMATYKKTS